MQNFCKSYLFREEQEEEESYENFAIGLKYWVRKRVSWR